MLIWSMTANSWCLWKLIAAEQDFSWFTWFNLQWTSLQSSTLL